MTIKGNLVVEKIKLASRSWDVWYLLLMVTIAVVSLSLWNN